MASCNMTKQLKKSPLSNINMWLHFIHYVSSCFSPSCWQMKEQNSVCDVQLEYKARGYVFVGILRTYFTTKNIFHFV